MTELPAQAVAVTRAFGHFVAVDQVGLEVRPGEVVGLLGANGAGKTTLIRLLLGLLRPSGGEIRLFGEPPSLPVRVVPLLFDVHVAVLLVTGDPPFDAPPLIATFTPPSVRATETTVGVSG